MNCEFAPSCQPRNFFSALSQRRLFSSRAFLAPLEKPTGEAQAHHRPKAWRPAVYATDIEVVQFHVAAGIAAEARDGPF